MSSVIKWARLPRGGVGHHLNPRPRLYVFFSIFFFLFWVGVAFFLSSSGVLVFYEGLQGSLCQLKASEMPTVTGGTPYVFGGGVGMEWTRRDNFSSDVFLCPGNATRSMTDESSKKQLDFFHCGIRLTSFSRPSPPTPHPHVNNRYWQTRKMLFPIPNSVLSYRPFLAVFQNICQFKL